MLMPETWGFWYSSAQYPWLWSRSGRKSFQYWQVGVWVCGHLNSMIILVGCGRDVGKETCGDRQPLSGGASYSGVVAVRFLVRVGVGKVCGIVSDWESGSVVFSPGPGGGGWVTLSGKGVGGLPRCGGCCWVSGWALLAGTMRVLGLSGQWKNLRGEAH